MGIESSKNLKRILKVENLVKLMRSEYYIWEIFQCRVCVSVKVCEFLLSDELFPVNSSKVLHLRFDFGMLLGVYWISVRTFL